MIRTIYFITTIVYQIEEDWEREKKRNGGGRKETVRKRNEEGSKERRGKEEGEDLKRERRKRGRMIDRGW